MNRLKLGIPKGSLENATIELFKKSGWKIQVSSRNYFPDIDDKEITCTLVRAQEMSRYVENGTLDLGLTGKDWIMENGSDVVVVADLVYSKASTKPARWVLVVRQDSPINKPEELRGKKISTELVSFTKNYFHLYVVAWHNHFNSIRENNLAGYIGSAYIELRFITLKERCMTASFLFGKDISFGITFGMRSNTARFGDNLTSFDVIAFNAAEKKTYVITRLTLIK